MGKCLVSLIQAFRHVVRSKETKKLYKSHESCEQIKNNTKQNKRSQEPERHYGNLKNLGQNTAPNIHKFWKTEAQVITTVWKRHFSERVKGQPFCSVPQTVLAKVHADIWSEGRASRQDGSETAEAAAGLTRPERRALCRPATTASSAPFVSHACFCVCFSWQCTINLEQPTPSYEWDLAPDTL